MLFNGSITEHPLAMLTSHKLHITLIGILIIFINLGHRLGSRPLPLLLLPQLLFEKGIEIFLWLYRDLHLFVSVLLVAGGWGRLLAVVLGSRL